MISDPVMPQGGEVRVGKYRLLKRLATGGMAEVFLGTDDGKALWAVKLVLPHLADQPEFIGLFLDEARLASMLNHPNIARVRDMGMENGRLFLAMEYVRGQPLSSLLQRLREANLRLTPVQAAAIVAQAAAGLNAAHDGTARDGTPLELVHRDISPQNLLLTEDGEVKVVDFGIAKARNKLVVTQSNTTRGKPWYMSPEQMRGEKLDRRADIFSLGAVLYELLVGERLFEGDVDQVMYRALNEPLPDIQVVKPDTPPLLAAMVKRACARKAEDRFATARDMEQELEDYVAQNGGSGDLGQLIIDHFPRMASSVDEILRASAPAPSRGTQPPRPATGSNLRSKPTVRPPSSSARARRSFAPPLPAPEEAAPSHEPTPADPVPVAAEPTVVAAPPTTRPPSPSRGTTARPPSAPAAPPPAPAAPTVEMAAPAEVQDLAAAFEPAGPPVEKPIGATSRITEETDALKAPGAIPRRGEGGRSKAQWLVGGAIVLAFFGVGGAVAWHFASQEEKPRSTAVAPVAPPPAPLLPAPGAAAPAKAEANKDDVPVPPLVPAARAAEAASAAADKRPRVRVSCSGPCTIYVDRDPRDEAPAEMRLEPGRHTVAALLGSDEKPRGGVTRSFKNGEVVFLHFGPVSSLNMYGGYMLDAQACRARGDLHGEITNLRAALARNPSSAEANLLLGKALFRQGESNHEAKFHLENYTLLVKKRPKNDGVDEILQKMRGR